MPYRLPTQVLVFCFRRKADSFEYLMLKRTARYGGFWQGVTGAPEGKESFLEGAARELLEETQLSPRSLSEVEFSYSFPVEDEWKRAYAPGTEMITEHVFLAEIAKDADPILSSEHDTFEWAEFDRAVVLLKWPNNRDALKFCDRLLQEGG